MLLQTVLHANNVKTFAKAMQYLAKLCDEFNVQAEVDRLKFKACNISKSAYIEIVMTIDFFEKYIFDEIALNSRVRMKTKHCFQVFHSLDKIEKCAIHINESKAIFHLLCHKSIKKTYKLNYEEVDMLNPMIDNEYDVRMVVRPKILVEALAHFTSNLEDISLNLRKDVIIFSTFIGDESGKISPEKQLQTEIKLDVADFDEYTSDGSPIDLTFSFKEFKTLIAYCDTISHPITFYVKQNGNALKFHTKHNDTFMIQFLIACFQTPSSINSTPSSGSSASSHQQQRMQQQQPQQIYNQQQQQQHFSGSSSHSHFDKSVATPHPSPSRRNDNMNMSMDQDHNMRYQSTPPNNTPNYDNDIDMLGGPIDYYTPNSTMASGTSTRTNFNPLSVGLRGQNLNVDDDDDEDEELINQILSGNDQSVQPSQ